MKAFYYNFSM